MGQTLTHGVYLPDEGERNCYSGLAANWQLLDGAVGTIAEHTSALAGKAPLVHTHVKSDITDFPAYGNAAGTICEGNDSRLSDARTPVAHTHGKADITDLFNSANTWSGENKYTSGFILSNISWSGVIPPSSAKPTVIEFKNADTRQGRYINRISSTSSETWIETIRNVDANTSYNHTVILKVDNSGNKSVYPSSNNDVDLGIAANQWNNLYAKNYFYNGTAWGLDKANVWTDSQTIASSSGKLMIVQDTTYELGQVISSGDNLSGYAISDKNNAAVALIDVADRSYGDTQLRIRISQKFDENSNNRSTSGTTINNEILVGIGPEKQTYVTLNGSLRAGTGNAYDLGTATKKWKTLNGINPGALSIPDGADSGANSSFTPDTTDWPKDGTAFQAAMPIVGWLRITIKNVTGNYAFVRRGTAGANQPWQIFADPSFAADFAECTLNVPVTNGTYTLKINSRGGFTAKVYPCLGNV